MSQKNMVKYTFRGLIAPVFTPFNYDKEQSLNLGVISGYADYLIKAGIKGVLVNGTSGEGVCMNVVERKLVVEEWARACQRTGQSLMVQVGGAPLPDVIELAKHAESLNADSILCLPELFFRPTTTKDLIDYLKCISAAVPTIPLLFYHIPMFTGVTINMADFLNEALKEVKTLVGIKFTSNNLEEGAACIALEGNPAIFLGADKIISGAFQLGFDSVIATSLNMLPTLSDDITKHMIKSELNLAKACQQKLSTAVTIITRNGSWVSTMKAAMNVMTNINVGEPRPPLMKLTKSQTQQIHDELVAAGYFSGVK